MPILSLIIWYLGHITPAAIFICGSCQLWSATGCPEELRAWVSHTGISADPFPSVTAPPMVQSSCLGHLLPWSHSCFKVFWRVIFWLRTYSINYICLPDFSLHCPHECVLISVLPAVVRLSHSCISEVARFRAGELQYMYNNGLYLIFINGLYYHCKQERCWLSLLQAGLVIIYPKAIYGVASPLFVSSQPIFVCPTGWGWTARAILSATGEKGRTGREDEEH